MGERKRVTSFARQLAASEIAVRRGHTLPVSQGRRRRVIVLEQYDHIAYRAVKDANPNEIIYSNGSNFVGAAQCPSG